MRILITGGAGFIGTHLTDELLRRGYRVSILDDLSTGRPEIIERHSANPNFSYCIDSVNNESTVARLMEQVDQVYHLAAAVGVRLVIDSSLKSMETNVLGTEILLRVAASKQTPVFIASSSEVYGTRNDIPFREDDPLVLGATSSMRWSYACSKALDECLAFAYHREKGLPVVVGRLFNTAGPGQTGRYGMVLPNFVRQALEARPITVFGDGKQTRCFCHVSDTVRALIGLMQEKSCVGQLFNIGATDEISMAELARKVLHKTHSKSPIEAVPYTTAYGTAFEDMRRRVPDTGKIEQYIGWRPALTLDRLIEDVIDSVRSGYV